MQFGEKLRAARLAARLTQKQLAEKAGCTPRTIQKYEAGGIEPKNTGRLLRLAEAAGVGADYFLAPEELEKKREEEAFLGEAAKQYGSRGRAQAQLILRQTSALFAGGGLTEEDREAFFEEMTGIYFDAKKKARKYTPKKYRGRDAE